ncbi:hypothetical protein SAMD00019534_065050 [Acytostelium subglobosum LB1]|uniref:hypothetical protein n=1 Tax=Acytostelium subglobosum LB1 TaxID=1410327 RepID=UPI000644E99E|nr:hypothetical protein SAMD00019534_065050 [Acytostelium subglobosum LB1]GAM23330.1 hypothetical protein SAMD00019534_065050 [Acytostelium subglobosum LB1]|eukprot:XP_012753779.1 hypothetical protein SAMD00019534_065050 [Acytostelium subglobosum LB1]
MFIKDRYLIGSLLLFGLLTIVNGQIYTFTPFYGSTHCQGQPNGVGFGAIEFQCSLNFSNDASFMIYNIYGTNQYNLSYDLHPGCDDYVHDQVFDLGECTYSPWAYSAYTFTQVEVFQDVKIPSSSVVFQATNSDCLSVQSYWYATNGTVISDRGDPWGTTAYYCQNGQPFQRRCTPSAPCQTGPITLDTCTSDNPFIVTCSQ